MSDKRALLDAAIQTYDGNCIMAVLIFMRKTVNQSKVDYVRTLSRSS